VKRSRSIVHHREFLSAPIRPSDQPATNRRTYEYVPRCHNGNRLLDITRLAIAELRSRLKGVSAGQPSNAER